MCCWLCQKSEKCGYEGLGKLCWIVLDEFMLQSPPQEPYSYQVCNSMYECDPSVVKLYDSDFWALSQNFEKQLLALSCLSVCLSVCLHRTSPLPIDGFSWSVIIVFFFFKSVKKIQVSLKSEKWLICVKTNTSASRWILVRIRNILNKNCTENQDTHFMFSNFYSKTVPFMRKCGKLLAETGHRWQYDAYASHAG